MPDILEPFHGDEPFSDNPDRPFITIGGDQIRRIAELIQGQPESSYRLEYGGSAYWFLRPLDNNTGEPGRAETVWSIEPDHR